MVATIAVLRGDGIGPEVVEAALSVLGACVPVRVREGRVGGDAIDHAGDPLPVETLELCQQSDAVLLGPVGGSGWEGALHAEDSLLRLRQGLGLYAQLRPVRYMGLPTPLREGLVRHADILVVRDLAGGVYFSEPRGASATEAFNTWRHTADEVRRVANVAFRQARQRRSKVTSVDKANLLETSRLWRRVVSEVAREYPEVELEHRYIDSMSFELLKAPHRFDVLLTESLFGDILADEAGAVVGSLGVIPSVSLGSGPSVFTPVHGTAPALAGRGIANPTGAILTVAMLLDHALGRRDLARVVESAVAATLRDLRTPDVGGTARTAEFTAAVVRNISWLRWAQTPEDQETASNEWGV